MSGLPIVPCVVEMFESACSRQFRNLGAYIKSTDDNLLRAPNLDGFVFAGIEASSGDLSIQIDLCVPGQFLRETMPSIEVENDTIIQYQEDWCMELANRFLGELKNQLLDFNCVVKMGLPRLCQEDLLSCEAPAGSESCERLFMVDSDLLAEIHNLPVLFRLHVKQLNPDLVFEEQEDELEDDDWFEVGELEHL